MSQRITVKLGGKERALAYDLNAFSAIEDEGGIGDGMSAKSIRLMLWAGLLHEDPELTIREVGAMVAPRDLETIAEAVGAAFNRDAPPAKDRPPRAQRKSKPKK